MIGDQQDFISRCRAVLPGGWFPDQSPVLNAILSGFSETWSWLYSLVMYAVDQTRLATAFDVWLDLAAADYFGTNLIRRPSQSDASFRREVLTYLLCERGTRNSVVVILESLTSRTPIIFEPARCIDTGCYGTLAPSMGGLSYNVCGGWGSLLLPYQCFITAYRPRLTGIADVSGWGAPAGAYGAGAIEYADLAFMEDQVLDSQIYKAISDVLPISVIAWTRICN